MRQLARHQTTIIAGEEVFGINFVLVFVGQSAIVLCNKARNWGVQVGVRRHRVRTSGVHTTVPLTPVPGTY